MRISRLGKHLGTALAGLALFIAGPSQAIKLDRLNACADVTATLNMLRSGQKPACREADGKVERALLDRIDPAGLMQTCYLKTPVTPAYAGFSCLHVKWKGTPELFCFRPSAATDIADYLDNYTDKYARQVKQYLDTAAACPAANGDAAPASMAPPALNAIAKMDFAYDLTLGKGDPGHGAMVHGFATLDPVLRSSPGGAIEFTFMHTGGPSPASLLQEKASRKRLAGAWTTYLDERSDDMLKKHLARAGLVVNMALKDIQIERTTLPARSQQDKEKLGSRWQRYVAAQLMGEGFESISPAEFNRDIGFDFADELGKILEKKIVPYGLRHRPAIKLAPRVHILIGSASQACIRNGGQIMGFVMGTLPTPNINSDYGSLYFGIVGVGACGRSTTTRRYITQVIDETLNSTLQQIERTP